VDLQELPHLNVVVPVLTLWFQQSLPLVAPVVVLHVQRPVPTLRKQRHWLLQMAVLVVQVVLQDVAAAEAIQLDHSPRQLLAVQEPHLTSLEHRLLMVLVVQAELHV
jgi:hypothetical protein